MADPENQMIPLAPAAIYRRSDEVSPTIKPFSFKYEKPPKANKCLVYILTGVVISAAILLIFASIFWRVNDPKLRIDRIIAVRNLQIGNSSTAPPDFLNMTVVAGLTIENENFGRFNFDGFKAAILFGSLMIGEGDVSGGVVAAKKTAAMDVTVEVRSGNLTSSRSRNVSGETGLVMDLVGYAKMSGKVHVMNVVNTRRTVELNCSMSLNLTSASITHLLCD